jgi:hypothetical protein
MRDPPRTYYAIDRCCVLGCCQERECFIHLYELFLEKLFIYRMGKLYSELKLYDCEK